MAAKSITVLPLTSRDFSAIVADFRNYVNATRPNTINAFFEGDVAKILLEMIAAVGDMTSYGIDRATQEAFLVTALLRESALRHADTFGYEVRTTSGSSTALVPVSYASIPARLTSAVNVNETQVITFTSLPTSGTFYISFDGEQTVNLAYNASRTDVQTALSNLSNVGDGNVVVTGSDGGPWSVTFVNALAGATQPLMTVNSTGLAHNEVQRVTITGATGGQFTLTAGSDTTTALSFDASAAAVQSALEILPIIGSGNVLVTGPNGGPWLVEFTGSLRNVNTALLGAGSALSPGGAAIVVSSVTNGLVPASSTTRAKVGADNALTTVFSVGQTFTAGSLNWEVSKDVIVDGGSVTSANFETKFAIPVVQGTSFQETFQSDGQAFQTYKTSAKNVDSTSLVVKVGTSSTPWVKVASIALAGSTNAYAVTFNNDGCAVLQFGDNTSGLIPGNNATVYVTGRSVDGLSGNVGPRALSASISGTADDGSASGLTVSIPMTNLIASSGGEDAETLSEIKRNVPKWIRTADQALTQEDYNTEAAKTPSQNGVVARAVSYLASGAIAFQRMGPTATPSNPITIPVGTTFNINGMTWEFSKDLVLTESDPVIFFNENVVHVYVWSAQASGFVGSSAPLVADVLAYLQARSVITTVVRVIPGRTKTVNIDLGDVYYASSSTKTAVEQALIATIQAFFLSDAVQPGTPLRLSDLYSAIELTTGVDHFVIASPVADVDMAKDEMPYLGVLTYRLVTASVGFTDDPNRRDFGNELYN